MSSMPAGSTDVSRYIMLRDSVTGVPETGYTITDLDLQYTRAGSAPSAKVDATELGSTDAAHSDNKVIEVDATNSPGLYRVDWPDAAFADGVDAVILVVTGAGLDPAVEEVQIALLSIARTEPGQCVPLATLDPLTKLDFLYKAWRNKKHQSADEYNLYDDGGTVVDQKATVSDADGVTTKGQYETGP